jgi:citrate lyase subunit beta / citryl-CoA lyase
MAAELPGPVLLFCPADRPDRYAKALAAADGVILDLEDGTGAEHKDAARQALLDTPLDPARAVVRVNAPGTAEYDADLEALGQTDYRVVMLPKSEERVQLDALGDRWHVIALCETAAGVLHAAEIAAAPNVAALMWGAEDLIASIGGRSSRFPDGRYRDVARHARSAVLLAAAAHGKAAIDAVYVNIPDLDGLAAEAADAAAAGFALKACIHPSQVPVVRRAYQPDEAQLAWARRVLEAARDAGTGDSAAKDRGAAKDQGAAKDRGAVKVDGQMIDAPLIRQAEAIIASAR